MDRSRWLRIEPALLACDDLGTSSGMVHARYTKLAPALILPRRQKIRLSIT
jgi:hypothetical protein